MTTALLYAVGAVLALVVIGLIVLALFQAVAHPAVFLLGFAVVLSVAIIQAWGRRP